MNVTVRMSNFGFVETALRIIVALQMLSPRWEQIKFVLHTESDKKLAEEIDKYNDSPLVRKVSIPGGWDPFPKQFSAKYDEPYTTLEIQNLSLEEFQFLETVLSHGDLKHKIWM